MTPAAFATALPFALGAAGCSGAAMWLWPRRSRFGGAGPLLVVAVTLAGLWAAAGLLGGPHSIGFSVAGSLRDLAWLAVIYRLFEGDGRLNSVAPLRPLFAVLAGLQAVRAGLLGWYGGPELHGAALDLNALLSLLADVGGLVLVHNLYAGASAGSRMSLRWPATGLALLWGFDLNHYTVVYLMGDPPAPMIALRGLSVLPLALLPVFGVRGGSETVRVAPSRAVVFQSASLGLIGAYLVAMVLVARGLGSAESDLAGIVQACFVAFASIVALVVLPSRRLRAWLRVSVTKHFFRHRYDYRAEWLRFIRTVAQTGARDASLEVRAVQSIADITDSSAGLLFVQDEAGSMVLAARWQWPTAEIPTAGITAATVRFFERTGYIVDIDAVREGSVLDQDPEAVPAWLIDEPRAWALVPLLHFDRLVGLVVLARPAQTRRLDWEDFDLLRVAGQQLASYLAEHAGQAALAETARFDDFNRRIAFVMHDIKNLASQLGLLARNAELHAENPAFRTDMLVTLRNAADKLNAMLGRLSRYGPGSDEPAVKVNAADVASAVVEAEQRAHPVHLVRTDVALVSAPRDTLEQALAHLVRNAIEASQLQTPVFVSVVADATHATIEIVDSGTGMSAEFVRNSLFKPFISSKSGGFGIGAFEARELIRAMGGRLDVESREGLGSRFVVRLPLASADELFGPSPRRIA